MFQVIDHKLYGSRSEFDSTIDQVLEEFAVELICLSGFMRILSSPFLRKWKGKKLQLCKRETKIQMLSCTRSTDTFLPLTVKVLSALLTLRTGCKSSGLSFVFIPASNSVH